MCLPIHPNNQGDFTKDWQFIGENDSAVKSPF